MKAEILKNISYGMYAVGVKDNDKASACIINSVTQISMGDKIHVAISIGHNTHSAKCIKSSNCFSVSVLSQETPASVIGVLGLVSGKNVDKLKNVRHKILVEGVPVIKENTCCWFLCEVKKYVHFENHAIIIGEIVAGSDISVGVPMTYEYYQTELNGTSPKDAPIYFPRLSTFDKSSGESFVCSVCGYTYNDPDFSFEELGEAWKCPVCKMPKAAFVRKRGN